MTRNVKWLTLPSETLLLRLSGATFRLGRNPVFINSSWEIRSGQTWGLVGDIDSGRNVFVRALCGEIPIMAGECEFGFTSLSPRFIGNPEAGLIHVTFDDMQQELASRESFAQLRWNSGLDSGGHSVRQFLGRDEVQDINPYEVIAPDSATERRFRHLHREVLQLTGITNLLDRTLDQVSNGERRKIFLARALLKDPAILLLEHPFDGLDREYQKHLHTVFSNLIKKRLHLIFIATSVDELPSFVSHVANVKNFTLINSGPRKKIGILSSRENKPMRSTAAHVQLPAEWKKRLHRQRSSGPVAKLSHVQITAGNKMILRDISWSILPGECWALSGPNGAGKSTLLSLLQGDNPQAYANQVEIFGRQAGTGQSIWDIKKRIGAVSPEMHLYFPQDIRVLDVVCTGYFDSLQLYKKCGAVRTRIAREWLHCLGLTGKERLLFGQLSTEEQRCVLIARAAVKPLDLFILDEPCMGFDSKQRSRVLTLIDRITEATHCTLIYVTHRKNEWPNCITHQMTLKDGRITHSGKIRRR